MKCMHKRSIRLIPAVPVVEPAEKRDVHVEETT